MRNDQRRFSTPRRAFLAGLGGVAASGTLPGPGAGAGATAPDVSVMTWNLYLGVDLFGLLEARSVADVRRIAGRMLADLERRPFPPRAAAIADEVAATGPDVVGVQEAALIRTRGSGDSTDDSATNASEVEVEVDFLDVLSSALADRGLDYDVVASVVTTDVEVPADVEGRRVDLRLADRDALLVRRGTEVDDDVTGRYDTTLEIPVDGNTIPVERGYCIADVVVDGVEVTVATTHLESVGGDVRLGQARELLDALPTEGPVVLAGDLNSTPEVADGVHELLTEPFDDVHRMLRPDEDGFTCCQDPDLRNDRSRLSRRIDAVLYAGLRPSTVERVGESPDDRVTASVDGETVRLWPSDHAGVVATFEAEPSRATATATADETETSSTTSSPSGAALTTRRPDRTTSLRGRTTSPSLSGFGLVVAVVAVLFAALARRRG